MNCIDVSKSEIVEKYIFNELSPRKLEEFEKHIFVCKDCFHQVLFYHSIMGGVEAGGKNNKFRLKVITDADIADIKKTSPVIFERLKYHYVIKYAKLIKLFNHFFNYKEPKNYIRIILDSYYQREPTQLYFIQEAKGNREEIILSLLEILNIRLPALFIFT